MSHGTLIRVIIHSNYFAVSNWLDQFDGKFAWRQILSRSRLFKKKRVHGYPKRKKLNF